MAADIFSGAASRFAGSFAAQNASITFSNGQIQAGALVQTANFGYAQSVTRLYEVGQDVVYYIGGRTQGQISLARVIGPSVLLQAFYATYGDVCQAAMNNIAFNLVSRCASNSPTFLCKYVVITNVGFGVSAGDMVVNESSSAIFSAMEYTDHGGG
jgi:hypothetical protein